MLLYNSTHAGPVYQSEREDVAGNAIFAPQPTPVKPAATQELRQSRARLARAYLNRIPSPHSTGGAKLVLNLFDAVVFNVELERSEVRSPQRFTWFGSIRGEPSSRVVLTVHDGIVAGNVFSPDHGLFRIGYAAPGVSRIEHVDEQREGQCNTTSITPAHKTAPTPTGSSAFPHEDCDHDDGSVIDVLVVYTANAATAAGGASALNAKIQLDVDTMADVLVNSGVIFPTVRVIHTASTAYDEDGTRSEHRARLTSPIDGVMDNAHTLRDDYGADIVTLYYDQQNSLCVGGDNDGEVCTDDGDCPDGTCDIQTGGGISWQLDAESHSEESIAFNVVKWSETYTFAHEVGHLLGCGHDRDNFQLGALYDYSWGWRLIGPDAVCYGGASDGWDCTQDSDCFSACLNGDNMGDDCSDDSDCPGLDGTCRSTCFEWRTMMCYRPGSIIPHFSNPLIQYQGVDTGVPEGDPQAADNAKTIINSKSIVANFRASHYWVDFNTPPFLPQFGCEPTPFDMLAEGINAAPIGGTVHIKAGFDADPVTLSKRMRYEAEGGFVYLGGDGP